MSFIIYHSFRTKSGSGMLQGNHVSMVERHIYLPNTDDDTNEESKAFVITLTRN